jgi:hypothetical protein
MQCFIIIVHVIERPVIYFFHYKILTFETKFKTYPVAQRDNTFHAVLCGPWISLQASGVL